MSYYNTNQESGNELIDSENKAVTQEQRILEIFKQYAHLTASRAWSIYGQNENIPLTSIRRGITNLRNYGKLIKTDTMQVGMYRKKEHVYKIANNQLNLFK